MVNILLASLALLPLYFLVKAVYQIFFHPLSHVPGPWYAAIGDIWNEWEQATLVQSRSIHSLLQKYGPIVRIGANRIVFVDDQAQKIVYGLSSKFPKDAYYKRFVTNGNDHSLTLLDHTAWSNRRRASAPHYANTNLALFQPEIQKYTIQLVDGLVADGGKTAFDLMSVFRHLLVDIVFSTAFDLDNGTLQKWAAKKIDPLDQAVTDFPKRQVMFGLFPGPLFTALSYVPIPRLQTFFKADNILMNATKRVYERFAHDPEALKSDFNSQDRKSLIHRMMLYRIADSGRPLHELEVISEAQANLIAGSETTATTASYMIWELSRNPDILEKVRHELDAALQERDVVNMTVLSSLPYFNAFIKEGLRMYAIIPGPLPRIVPPNVVDLTIAGIPIPPGTCVATQAWSLHRQEDVFPDPYSFKPERWLDGKETERMRASFIPFGVGPRVCVGQNMANIMLRVMVSTVVRHFNIQPAPETTVQSMRIWESFALFPAGLQAKFALTPRHEHI